MKFCAPSPPALLTPLPMNLQAPHLCRIKQRPLRPQIQRTRAAPSLAGPSTYVRAARVFALCLAVATASAWAQGSAEQGFRLMAAGSAGNCVVCHSMPGASGPPSTFGPALHQVGTRYSAQELRQWVTDARLIKPATLMPPFGTTQGTHSPMLAQPLLSAEDIGHVVAALQTLR